MDTIDTEKNRVVTDCGHTFHCSCLMQNAVYNGFGCPYCRTVMVNEPPAESDESDDESDYLSDSLDVNQEIGNYALTSFRMFMQRLDGEDPEEELEEEYGGWNQGADETEDDETEDGETEDGETEDDNMPDLVHDAEDNSEDEEESRIPNVAYMVTSLMEHDITYEDLVTNVMYQHSNWTRYYYRKHHRRYKEVYAKFSAIISRYPRTRDIPAIAPPEVDALPSVCALNIVVPEVAETKTFGSPRRGEIMFHV